MVNLIYKIGLKSSCIMVYTTFQTFRQFNRIVLHLAYWFTCEKHLFCKMRHTQLWQQKKEEENEI